MPEIASRTPNDATSASWRGPIGDSAYRKVTKRLMPVLIVFYILAYIGRANLGYAALKMNADLGISDAAYGLVAGIFFIGYFLFEVPSNILLDRFGARVWIARILVTWGIIAALTAFVQNVDQLYIARFLLGAAEAGFFPGVILYLSRWYLGRDAAKAISLFMLAIPVSYIIGAPLSGLILDHVHWLGHPSWRWVLLLESLPSILGGIACFFVLPSTVQQVKWLTAEEKAWLTRSLDAETALKPACSHKVISKEVFLNPIVWALVVIYFAIEMGEYGLGFWIPQIIEHLGHDMSATTVGFLTSATYVLGAIAMVLSGRSSDKHRERRWHNIVPMLLCAMTIALVGLVAHSLIAVVFLAVIVATVYALFGPFWSLQSYFLSGATAVVGIALINSFGNLAGFVSPYLIGLMDQLTGDQFAGFYIIGALMIAAAVVVHRLVRNDRLHAQEDTAQSIANPAVPQGSPLASSSTHSRNQR